MSKYDIEKIKWNSKADVHNMSTSKSTVIHRYDHNFRNRSTLRPVHHYFENTINEKATVLDFGCGDGWTALSISTAANNVFAFDISEGRVKFLKNKIELNRLDNIEIQVANGENLPYFDETFDLIFGNAILHHITLDRCLPEIARVLKKGGRAAFCEPFAHNPFINLFRFIKHNFIEKHKGTDRPLKYGDLQTFKKYFKKVTFIESSFLRDKYSSLIGMDQALLKIGFLRRYVSYVTILLEKEQTSSRIHLRPGNRPLHTN